MTDRYIYFVGLFVHNGKFADMVVGSAGWARPRVRQALDQDDLERLAGRLCPDEGRRQRWNMSFEDGLLVFSGFGADPLLHEFLRVLFEDLSCDLVEGTSRVADPKEWGLASR